MRKIIVSEMVSLDGFFEDKNKELGWHTLNEEFFEYSRELLSSVDTILFGRITYQMMAAYWSNAVNEDAVITHKMNQLNKIVFTKTLKKVTWNNSEIAKSDLKEEILKLKKEPGKDMVILGSGSIVSELSNLGLIDEYRLAVNPLILGKGNTLFKSIHDKVSLKLVQVKTLSSGVVMLHYSPGER